MGQTLTDQPNTHNSSDSQDRVNRLTTYLRLGIAALIVICGLYVALSPGVVYAPVPKIVLFCLISFLPAILFGAEAAARFDLKLPGFAFTTAGAAAIALGTLLLLSYLAKPEEQIAVYRIVDDRRQPVLGLDRDGAVEVQLSKQALMVTKLIDGNNVVLIFPEQVGECELVVKPLLLGPAYIGKVSYSGNRQVELMLGRDLKSQ